MPNVKVYSTKTCHFCHALKEFLKEHNIAFQEIDVTYDEALQQEMINKSGQMGVPVTDIDGKIVVGFDQEKISQLLNIK